MPLLLEIFDRGRRLTDYHVRGAHATGPESLPLPGRVVFQDGLLRVEAGDAEGLLAEAGGVDPGDEADAYTGLPSAAAAAIGVALLWDAGDRGEFVLETTRLPPRPEPYILNVELARHRLMRLLQKQEDWSLWELAPAAPAVAKARQAQLAFAECLGLLSEPAEAARKADEALAAALDAGDALARSHADLLWQRRRRSGLPRSLFGVRADVMGHAPRGSAAYRQAITGGFDCVSVPMPWRLLQPDEDAFDTVAVDEAVEMAGRAKLPVVAGPLIDLADASDAGAETATPASSMLGVPEWLFLYENNFQALRDLAFDYVRAAVTRYRRVVKLWNVVAGVHAATSFGLTFEQMIELTRLLVGQVKAVQPGAKTLVTVKQPFGEYLAAPGNAAATAVPPMLYAEMIAQSGVQVDGFGVELVMGRPNRGRHVRDLFQLSAMLDRFASLGKPLFITAITCPSSCEGATREAGRWGKPWDRELQAQWLKDVYQVALSRPYVENIAWADLVDGPHNQVAGGGRLDDLLKPKPAAVVHRNLRQSTRPFLRPGRPGAQPPAVTGQPASA